MTNDDKAACWDMLKEACHELSKPKKIFGIRFPSRTNEVAKEIMDIIINIEILNNKNINKSIAISQTKNMITYMGRQESVQYNI
jgi:hypothetical protein